MVDYLNFVKLHKDWDKSVGGKFSGLNLKATVPGVWSTTSHSDSR